MGIRSISVNDGYDSKRQGGMTGGMDVALRNLIYQMYSRDLSHYLTVLNMFILHDFFHPKYITDLILPSKIFLYHLDYIPLLEEFEGTPVL